MFFNMKIDKLKFYIKVNIKNTPKMLETLSNVLGVF